jgi:hypothetical protein
MCQNSIKKTDETDVTSSSRQVWVSSVRKCSRCAKGIHQSQTAFPWFARLKAQNHSKKMSQSEQNIDVKTELEAELDNRSWRPSENQRHLF